MFLTGPIRDLGGEQILEDLTAPDEDVFGAGFAEDILRNPLPSGVRFDEIQRAEGDPFFSPLGGRLVVPNPERLSPIISAEEARERAGSLRLDIPDEGIREAHLELLIEARREEVLRQNILARRDLSTLGEIALIGQSIAASALDPVNVGAAFVPVIREARFAAWAQRFGVAGARAARGTVEGVAGAALVEPIVLAAATAEQSDYDAWDSLMNIALGGALGGGLHVTGGAALDRIRRARGRPTTIEMINRGEFPQPLAGRPAAAFREIGDTFADISRRLDALPFEDQNTLMRVAAGQLMSGQSVEVAPLLRRTPQFADVLAPASRSTRPVLAELTADGRLVRAPDTATAIRARRVTDTETPPRRPTAEGEVDVVRGDDGAPRLFDSVDDAQRAADAEGLSQVDPVPVSTPEGTRIALATDADPELVRAARIADIVREPDAERPPRGALEVDQAGRVVQQEAQRRGAAPDVADGGTIDDVVVQRLRNPERFDPIGSEPADGQRLADEAGGAPDDVEEALNEALAQLEALRARGALTAEGEAILRAAEEAAETGRRRAESIRAAAHCLAA